MNRIALLRPSAGPCCVALMVLGFLAACEADPPPATGTEAAEATAPAAVKTQTAKATGQPLELLGAGDAVVLKLEPLSEGGYRMRGPDGEKLGKVKIEADRVKVKDKAGKLLAKVKKKDTGFKVYGPDDVVLFKAKDKGNKIKIKRDDVELGQLKGGVLTLNGKTATVSQSEGKIVVNGPQGPLTLRGPVKESSAVWLGADGLTLHQRLAIVVFLEEIP